MSATSWVERAWTGLLLDVGAGWRLRDKGASGNANTEREGAFVLYIHDESSRHARAARRREPARAVVRRIRAKRPRAPRDARPDHAGGAHPVDDGSAGGLPQALWQREAALHGSVFRDRTVALHARPREPSARRGRIRDLVRDLDDPSRR